MTSDLSSTLADLSITEKAALTSGAGTFETAAAAGRRPVVFSDGPNGVRAQEPGAQDNLAINPSLPATCYPPTGGLAQSWDEDLMHRVGAELAKECRSFGVDVLLAPAVNIKRDPRCGRNFEYLSEDPILAGRLGAAYVRGLQSQGVGASVKHFVANNQETDRMRASSEVDARALREIYLKVFEIIVKESDPWTVMSSYNRVNGEQVSNSRWLLTQVLRNEWGFEGAVVSDWGAVWDGVRSVAAGLDIAMPGPRDSADAEVTQAVADGRLDPAALDAAAANVLRLLDRAEAGRALTEPFDADAATALAREAAVRSIVLLTNDDDLLPLRPEQKVAVIGKYAVEPRNQGGGSAFVNPRTVDEPLAFLRAAAPEGAVTFERGFDDAETGDEALREAAVAAAKDADVAVVFLGLDLSEESEGFDREHIDLPANQLELLRAVYAVQPRTVVVLSHGGAVVLGDVVDNSAAILTGGLLGQGCGSAVTDVLYGRANPSGRLTETVPVRLADAPSYLNFPGENSTVVYGESIFVGYRGYDARELDVTFPFGHGLSYTTFEYADFTAQASPHGIDVSVQVTNTGDRDGREVVQFYTTKPNSKVRRAPRELKAYRTVEIAAGATVEVTATIAREDLAYWDVRPQGWIVEDGEYEVAVGASSRDLRGTARVTIAGDEHRIPLSMASVISEIAAHPVGREVIMGRLMNRESDELIQQASESSGMDVLNLVKWMPFWSVERIGGQTVERSRLEALIDQVNAQITAD